MDYNREETLAVIEEIITPYVGRTMAQASTKVQCEKLGILSDTITRDQLDALVYLLSRALRVFIGGDKTGKLIENIHKRVDQREA